jgi:hypothetical protein
MSKRLVTSPKTAAEAVDQLTAEGYSLELSVRRDSRGSVSDVTRQWLNSLVVDQQFSFRGPSDAGPNEIVLGVRFPRSGIKGIITERVPGDPRQ